MEQQLFPRKIATALTEGRQFTVYSKEEMIAHFEESNFIDCRINAYPVEITNSNLVLLIDLDLKDKKTANKILKRHLNDTLANIEDNNLIANLVLWTGNGNHIYLGLKTKPLVELLSAEVCGGSTDANELAKSFMKFAKIFLSNGRADICNAPSLKSCLLRVPYSLNLKCIKKSKESEVKIIQSNLEVNDGIPQIMLSEFYTYLVSKKLNEEARIEERSKYKAKGISRLTPWIEKLLKTPISDYRKYCIWKIFVPYLTNKRSLPYDEIYSIIEGWSKQCSNLRVLDFDVEEYTSNVYDRVEDYFPISLDNLEGEKGNKDVYQIVINALKKGHIAKPPSGVTGNYHSN